MKIALHFASTAASPELLQIDFVDPKGELISSYRGKSAIVDPDVGSFQWTAAVRAFATLVVGSTLSLVEGRSSFVLEGEGGSPAASLDYAIGKPPRWILDLFGTDSNGKSRAMRIFRRENPERKLPGPVKILFTKDLLEADSLTIRINGGEVRDAAQLQRLLNTLKGDAPHSQQESAGMSPQGGSAQWQARCNLRELLLEEARFALLETELLEPLELDATASRLKRESWVDSSVIERDIQSLKGNLPDLGARYRTDDDAALDIVRGRELIISCVPMAFGALVLLSCLRDSYKVRLKIDFSFPSTSTILGQAGATDGMVLSWGAGMRRGSVSGAEPFVASMLLPRTSIDLIAGTAHAAGGKPLDTLYLALDPAAYPTHYFNALRRADIHVAENATLVNASQAEILSRIPLNEGGAILSFPLSAIASRLRKVAIVDRGNRLSRVGDNVLYLSSRIDEAQRRALLYGVRGAWYRLMEEEGLLASAVDSIYKDLEYMRYLARLGGLYRF